MLEEEKVKSHREMKITTYMSFYLRLRGVCVMRWEVGDMSFSNMCNVHNILLVNLILMQKVFTLLITGFLSL